MPVALVAASLPVGGAVMLKIELRITEFYYYCCEEFLLQIVMGAWVKVHWVCFLKVNNSSDICKSRKWMHQMG